MTNAFPRLVFLSLALTLFGLSACDNGSVDQSETNPADPHARSVTGTGIIRKIDLENVELQHDAIADALPAGTETFPLRSAADAVGLYPGDAVEFSLMITANRRSITGLRRRDVTLTTPSNTARASATPISALQEGDLLPEFTVVNERGERLTRENFTGKTLVMTFVVVRCPRPDHCPLISQNFLALAQKLDTDQALSTRVRLLTVCLDPVRESSHVLINYRGSFDAPRELWQITTAAPDEIERLGRLFDLKLQMQEQTLAHDLCTVIVDPGGRIRKLLRGNSWHPDDLLSDIR